MPKNFCNKTILLMAVLGLASISRARAQADDFRPFNGFFADLLGDDSAPQKPVRAQQQARPQPTPAQQQPTQAPRQATPADGADQGYQQPRPAVRHVISHSSPTDAASAAPSPAGSDAGGGAPRVSNQPTNKNLTFQFDDGANGGANGGETAPQANSVPGRASVGGSASVGGGSSSLHDVLQGSQQSPFGPVTPSAGDTAPATPSPSVSNDTPTPGTKAGELSSAAGQAQTNSPGTLPVPPATDAAAGSAPTSSNSGGLISDLTRSQERPITAPVANSDHPAASNSTSATPTVESGKAAKSDAGTQVLSAHKSPILSTETIGPQRISVGKEASYEVVLQNTGEVAAEEVSVSVLLPAWADIASVTPSTGQIRTAAAGQREPCKWIVGRVEAKSREKLSLKIIPRASKPFELAVRFDFKAAPAQAMIEVQEPRLTMKLEGPREVLFGKHEVFKLKLSNQGTGAADNVVLRLMPLAGGDPQPVSHKLGTLAAGDERSIEIELTARQAGALIIRVDATGDASARAELAEKIVVHKPELKIETDGPVVQYVGTPATYKFHVRNPGDAPANNVKLAIKLPPGVKFLNGSNGAAVTPADDGNKVQWTIDQIAPGGERELFVRCTLALSGANRIEIGATGEDELAATGETVTRAEALADLRLDVKDPEGPVPVGQEATYELRIRNRGTKAAEGIEVFAFFSSGIEPIAGEGHPHRVSPGQVVFAPLPVLPPATEVTLRVRAKATSSGNHVFRAEIHCRESGTRLVREETTHFYQEGIADTQPDTTMPRTNAQAISPPAAVSPTTAPVASAPQSAPAPLAASQDTPSKADARPAELPGTLPPQQSASPLPGAGSANRSPTGTRF